MKKDNEYAEFGKFIVYAGLGFVAFFSILFLAIAILSFPNSDTIKKCYTSNGLNGSELLESMSVSGISLPRNYSLTLESESDLKKFYGIVMIEYNKTTFSDISLNLSEIDCPR